MQFNKKYAIRKLAIGVASVAIGFTTVGISPQIVLANEVEHFGRTNSGDVDNTGNTNLPKPTEEIKSVPNGEKNFYSTVAFTTEAGLGSGTLINEDTIVTVAHNFVHLNTKNNPITVENNVNKLGDIHIATLPNGKQVKFSNDDVKYWNREGYVQGFKNDLAVVKLRNKFTGETGATLHNEVTKLSNGDKIHVFGFPKGKLNPILNGTVENVENYGANIMGVAYQGSAPGMSGGGLYNANGELIGVNQNGVEGLRSGGITFSKEQLDWINSIARDENAQPVYLQDEPQTDDKEELHPTHGKLLANDESVVGIIGKLYEDGTYIMSKDKSNASNLYLNNNGGGANTMFGSFPNDASLRNKVKRIEVDGKLSADYLMFASSYLDNIEEIDARGITLSNNATKLPMFAGLLGNNKLNKLQIDPDLSLSKIKNASPIVSDAPNLKLTNEQVTQLLKNVAFESGNRLFNNVGIERLDLTSFDNSKLNNNGVLFKNLKGLKEIAFGDKFNFNKYVPTGQSNSYFDTDLSTVEKVSGTDNSTFIKEWVKAVKDANIPKKEVVYKDGVNIGTLEEVLNKVTFEKGVYTIGKTKQVIPEPKVEYLGKGKDIIRKTTTYRENSETGNIEENVKEEVNPEVDMHFYFVYSIKDSDTFIPSHPDEIESSVSKYKGKIIKEVEYIPEQGKWFANSTLHNDSAHNIVGVVKWPDGEKFEYNNDIYKVVGSSVEHIIAGPDSNDTERSNYERDSKIWHRFDDSRLFYQPDTSNSIVNEDYKNLNNLGLAKDGKVVKVFLYAEPVRGTYTQTFVDEDQVKAHENDEDYNPENYFIKDKYDSGKHKLTEDFVLPKVPKYIQKNNKIYKLSSHGTEPTINKYVDADLSTEYRYKVLYDNTTKEEITRVAPKDIYVAAESRDRTSENVKTNGTEGITKTVTTYKVDNDGNLTEEVSTPEKTEVINNVIKVGTKPKVERFEKDNKIIEKTTSYTVNEHNGEITENSTERVIKDNNKNDETVNLHYYIDYYIPSSLEEWRNGANISSKLFKSVEYNRPTKWTKGEDLTNGLYDGVEKTVEYNGIKYVPVGLESTRHITNETTNNTDTKEDYDKNNSNWRVGTEPVFKPTVAEEGGVYRLPVFLQPQVGWITQKFYSEEYKKQTNPNLNTEERYKLKDDVVLPPHSIDDKVEVPNAPQYIQKSNRIYKLVSNDPIPKQYEVANNSISYFYKNLNLQSTEKTVETQPVVKYKADDSRERNSENIRIDGKPKITQIITNPKVNDDGELGEETFEEIVQDSIDTIVKIGTKPKVQYNTKGKNVIKTTTTYTVNEKTGEVTEHKTSEVVDTLEGLMPPTIDKDEYNGNISTNTPIDEDGNLVLPPVVEILEYKGTLSTNTPIDANGDLILPPVVDVLEHKEPSNNTQPINDNNQKPNKLEEPQNIQQPNNDNTNNTSEVKYNKVSQKQALPKTNALHNTSYILGLLLSTIGLKRNKKD